MITFHIPGIPQQQGSKNRGAHGQMYDANRNLPAWRDSAIWAIKAARQDKITGPVIVTATFRFPRPASHYGTGRNQGLLKASAPDFHTGKPDLDKLQRALGDALTQSGLIRDDSLIVRWDAMKKWTDTAPETRVEVCPL